MSFNYYLLELRGGCRCQDPGAAPPCSNCTNEITYEEAEHIFYELQSKHESDLLRVYSHIAGEPENLLEMMAYKKVLQEAGV